MKIGVKTSKGEVYSIEVESPDCTILQFKEKIAEQANVSVSKIRLIHIGKLLKDEETLKTYKLEEGSTVHLVLPNTEKKVSSEKSSPEEQNSALHKSADSTSTRSASSSVPNLGGAGMGRAPGNPFGQFDPSMMKGFSSAEGQDGMHAMMQSKMKELMKNPEQMKVLMEASLSMQNIPEPTKKMMMDNINKFADMAKTDPEQFEMFVNHILDNPNLSDLYMNQAMGGGMPQGGFPGQQPSGSMPANIPSGMPGMPSFNREEALSKYKSELSELQQIGYNNVELNLIALVCSEGDLTKAVNLIMDWTSEENN
ncbi:ubiquilin [Nematocida minor]|uniref:ubiquilin n=1 Tax=Nematocida minor TaxID=1912983 RepID=UPI0022209E73|nr:ubiquilin [Nematocida minor]XP_051332083.1 ubiquilin [Nematocida minor]KAI5188813.1 ubiquilin [Nematocida minor]KAI5188917.1 ubiquilin [Nematocida minor]